MATDLTCSIGWPIFCATSIPSGEPTSVTTKGGSRIKSPKIVPGTRWFTICSRRRGPLPVRARPVTCFGIRACLDNLSNTLNVFLGANVACAQCHDHPLADWTQREFYELAAFFGATDVSDRDPRKVGNRLKNADISKQDVIKAVAPNMARVHTKSTQSLKFPHDYAYDDYKPGSRWSLCSLFGSREMKKDRLTKSTIRMPNPSRQFRQMVDSEKTHASPSPLPIVFGNEPSALASRNPWMTWMTFPNQRIRPFLPFLVKS